MANLKATRTGNITRASDHGMLDRERQKSRGVQIIFALFSILLILLTVLSLAMSI